MCFVLKTFLRSEQMFQSWFFFRSVTNLDLSSVNFSLAARMGVRHNIDRNMVNIMWRNERLFTTTLWAHDITPTILITGTSSIVTKMDNYCLTHHNTSHTTLMTSRGNWIILLSIFRWFIIPQGRRTMHSRAQIPNWELQSVVYYCTDWHQGPGFESFSLKNNYNWGIATTKHLQLRHNTLNM